MHSLLSAFPSWEGGDRFLATATDRGDGKLGVEYRGRRGINQFDLDLGFMIVIITFVD